MAQAAEERTKDTTKEQPETRGSGAPANGAPGRDLATRGGTPERLGSHAAISSEAGTTRIADVVVAKIAGLATHEITGVHSMGKGLARRIGAIKARVPGQGDSPASTQGVSVEVGQKEAAVDLEIVTWYGESIAAVTEEVRANVISSIETMTGLGVVEVNIHVVDIHVEGEETSSEPRVQ